MHGRQHISRQQKRYLDQLTREDILKFQYCQRLIENGYSEAIAVASTRSELKYNPALH